MSTQSATINWTDEKPIVNWWFIVENTPGGGYTISFLVPVILSLILLKTGGQVASGIGFVASFLGLSIFTGVNPLLIILVAIGSVSTVAWYIFVKRG